MIQHAVVMPGRSTMLPGGLTTPLHRRGASAPADDVVAAGAWCASLLGLTPAAPSASGNYAAPRHSAPAQT